MINENIKRLMAVNKSIAKLTVEKEELTASIIKDLGHRHEGQRSYEYDIWKIEVKTPMTYSLDTKLYKTGDVVFPIDENPIRESVSYTVDKNLCDELMDTGSFEAREALSKLVTKKDGKASVVIKPKV